MKTYTVHTYLKGLAEFPVDAWSGPMDLEGTQQAISDIFTEDQEADRCVVTDDVSGEVVADVRREDVRPPFTRLRVLFLGHYHVICYCALFLNLEEAKAVAKVRWRGAPKAFRRAVNAYEIETLDGHVVASGKLEDN